MAGNEFYVRFWGVRGSIPSPGPKTVVYGGNTPCIEVMCGPKRLIFDAGSGIRALGDELCANGGRHNLDLFFTHCHYDHIEGLPFFAPLQDKRTRMRMWSGHLPKPDTRKMVKDYMQPPYFPVGPDCFPAEIEFHEFSPGDELAADDSLRLRTVMLNHPGGAVGYRIDYEGKSICYVTDTEHVPGQHDQDILSFIDGAEVVIYDAAYDDDEFHDYVGYGHSTWQEGCRLCDMANAGQYVVFHHRPGADDDQLRTIETKLKSVRPASLLAREGLILKA